MLSEGYAQTHRRRCQVPKNRARLCQGKDLKKIKITNLILMKLLFSGSQTCQWSPCCFGHTVKRGYLGRFEADKCKFSKKHSHCMGLFALELRGRGLRMF